MVLRFWGTEDGMVAAMVFLGVAADIGSGDEQEE
jgi:hypothetical protein